MKGFVIEAENARRSYLSEQYKRVKALRNNIDIEVCRAASIREYAETGFLNVPQECIYEIDEHRPLPHSLRCQFENEHPGYFIYQRSNGAGPWTIGLDLSRMK